MKHTVIITAGGIGRRMGEETPKQFLYLCEKPILIHTMELFYNFNPLFEIIITLPKDWISYWNELIKKHRVNINHIIVTGGEQRYHSIKNALGKATGDTIAIHDGVRPLVSKETLTRIYQAINQHDAIIPFIPVKESIREINKNKTFAKNRDNTIIVQTPQCFKRTIIIDAYKTPFQTKFTDDATLVESAGYKVSIIKGNEENIKITSSYDLLIAQAIKQSQAKNLDNM